MKFLLLALFVGAACANLQDEIMGAWNTYTAAAKDLGKVAENGPLRHFLRTISCLDPPCSSVSLNYWMKINGTCKAFAVVGNKVNSTNVYNTDLSGHNFFYFAYKTKDMLIICMQNTDEYGTFTEIVEAVARPGHELTEEELNENTKIVVKRGIPIENIMNMISKDTCPE